MYVAPEGKFHAYISYLNKLLHIGTFSTAVDAAKARDDKAVSLLGPFARTNFPVGAAVAA